MKKSDLIIDGNKGNINQVSLDSNEEVKRKRSKCIIWLLDIIENIFSTLIII
jgi:hypothetical protein